MIRRCAGVAARASALGLLLLVACGGPTQSVRRTPSQAVKPRWVDALPKNSKDTYYFVGAKARAKTLEDGRKHAFAAAAEQAATVVGVRVSSEFFSLSSTERDRDQVTNKVDSKTAAFLRGLAIGEEYTERVERESGKFREVEHDVWVLVSVSAAEVDAERQRQQQATKAAVERALKLLGSGSQQAKASDGAAWVEARVALAQAVRLLESLPPEHPGAGAHATAGDLLDASRAELDRIDGRAHTVSLKIESPLEADPLATSFAKLADKRGFKLVADAAARFFVTFKLRPEAGTGDKVMNQQLVKLSYAVTVLDRWQTANVTGANGVEKGFGRSDQLAAAAALDEVAQKATPPIIDSLAQRLGDELK